MATSHPSGAIKKQPINRKSVFTPKEYPPVCGKAIPSSLIDEDVQAAETKQVENSYGVEKWNSLLKMKQEIENIEKGEKLLPTLKSTDNLTPRSKSVVMPKINQKLNTDSNRQVFKNLVPINVNDSLLPKKATCIKSKYKITKTNKIPAPDLADFLDPLPPLTHEVDLPKEIELEFPEFSYNTPMMLLEQYKAFAGID